MSLPVFYLPATATSPLVQLSEETSKHIVQVLRMKHGERLQLTDGKGTVLNAEIVDDHKKKCTVKVVETVFEPQPQKAVTVAISLLKNNTRFEWFLEKATEIGVTEIIPIICDRTEKQHFRFDRMNNIVIAAMLQSQQSWLPVLHQPTFYKNALSNSYQNKLIAHCEDGQKATIPSFSFNGPVQILIGPEGDFTPAEIDAAKAYGYLPVSLGETRLRAETAGVVAATLLCNRK